MALNSYVTSDGKEMGRAQATQAEAAGVSPSVEMNPVLLKATSDTSAQVIILGKPVGNMNVQAYRKFKPEAWEIIQAAYHRLAASYDLVIIEGAGSPAEINLKSHDIVNMRVALFANAPVLLVGDIDRGGVFASFVGTWELLEPEERERIAGFVINKFRGDASLLQGGIDFLSARTGRPTFGVVPYLQSLRFPEEDGVALDDGGRRSGAGGRGETKIKIAVARLPHISNFTDFDPFLHESSITLSYIGPEESIPEETDLLILPGTKNTLEDLEVIQKSGLADRIRLAHARGVMIAGICGGYQMLGETIEDPHQVESSLGRIAGLGLLPIRTVLEREKRTAQVKASALAAAAPVFSSLRGESISCYEIHMGRSVSTGEGKPLFQIQERNGAPCAEEEGMMAASGQVWGCYLHGIFENDRLRAVLLNHLRLKKGAAAAGGVTNYLETKEAAFDRVAETLRQSLDWKKLDDLL
jgi:adenosylcobyric acid synthase